MGIDLSLYYIEVSLRGKTGNTFIKVPKSEESLNYSLVAKEIATNDTLGYEIFDSKIKSVNEIKKVNKITIKKPTNIYYLNMYLNLLSEKNILFANKEMEIDTPTLQKNIAELIGSENKEMNYEEIKIFLKGKNPTIIDEAIEEEVVEEENEVKNEVKEKPKKEKKLMFDINEIQREHKELKEKRKERKAKS